MADNIDYNSISEKEMLNKISASIQRHVVNLHHVLVMMKNGQFISAFDQIKGSNDGLQYIKKIIENRISSLEKTSNENN